MTASSRPSKLKNWLPSGSIANFRQEMNEMMENFFSDSWPSFREAGPKIDLCETADAVEVTADLPGYAPNEVSVEVGDNYLTLSGSHEEVLPAPEEAGVPTKKYHRIERHSGSFSRSILLPCPVDENQVEAKIANGVLSVRLPKTDVSKRRRVEVQGEKPSS